MTKSSEVMARLRGTRKAAGLCYKCGEPATEKMKSCAKCRAVTKIKGQL